MARTLALVPFALALSTPAFAHPMAGRGPIDADKVMERADKALDKVDATDDQRSSVRAIVEDTVPQLQAYRDEAGQLREEIKAVFKSEEIDRTALTEARLDLVDLFDRATETVFTAMADLAEVFSLEQREELREMREARRAKWQRRFAESRP